MDWQSMSPRERDALVAEKVMGLDVRHAPDPRGMGVFTVERQWDVVYVAAADGPRALPEYTTSIAAAWEVREQVRGWFFSKRQAFLRNLEAGVRLRTGIPVAWPDLWLYVEPEDAALAALRAKGVDV